LILARYRNHFLLPGVFSFLRMCARGPIESMRPLAPTSTRSRSLPTRDHTGPRPLGSFPGHDTETRGLRGLAGSPRRNLQWPALGLLNLDRLRREFEIGRREGLGLVVSLQ